MKRSASAPSARHASPKAGATRASGAPATGGSAASAGAPAVGGASGSATAAPGSPQQALTDFYTRGAQGDIAGAWALGTERVHAEVGGYDSFRAQESSLRSIAFPVLTLSRESGGTATVAFHSTAVHTTRTDHCTGSATLVQSGGRWLVDMLENVSCVP